MNEFSLLIKPVGADCNLDCRYCFYKRAAGVFNGRMERVMSDEILRTMTERFLGLGFRNNVFGWQGGEPTLAGLDFFDRAVSYQSRFGLRGQNVSNGLQTNGLLIDDAWARFLHSAGFLTGISIDGPEAIHDHCRKTHGSEGSFGRTMNAVEAMTRHSAEFNVLTVLTDISASRAREIYSFFLTQNFNYQQYIPCLETDHATGKAASYSIRPGDYGRFLCDLFDAWYENGFPRISIRNFDVILLHMLDGMPAQCTMQETCSSYLLIEHNGDIFPCDFYVYEQWRLGNLRKDDPGRIFSGEKYARFANLKRDLNRQCVNCKWLDLCRGDCTRFRMVGHENPSSLSYYCHAIQMFLEHTGPRFKRLADRVRVMRSGRPDPGPDAKPDSAP